MGKAEDLPMLLFHTREAFEGWLELNHHKAAGVLLHIAKKDSGIQTVTYQEALEIALCYGWIDSRKEKYDEKTWLQRFTPRKGRSIWSQVNKEKAEMLIAKGKMKEPGYEAIELAKRNGQWDRAYEPQSKAAIPEDFEVILEQHPSAKHFFETLDSRNKYAILFRIQQAKKKETREKRIRQFVTMLENGEKIYNEMTK